MPTSLNDIASTCRNTVFLLILQYLNRRDDYENLKGVSQEIYTAMLALKKESPFAIKQLFSPSIDYDKLKADMLLICKKSLKNDFSFFGQFVSTRKTRGKYLLEFITKCAGPENTILLAIAAERSKGKQLIWMLNEQYLNSGALNSHLFTYDNKKNRKKADKLLSLDLENILKKAISEPSAFNQRKETVQEVITLFVRCLDSEFHFFTDAERLRLHNVFTRVVHIPMLNQQNNDLNPMWFHAVQELKREINNQEMNNRVTFEALAYAI